MVIKLKMLDSSGCIREGLLRKIPPSSQDAEASIKRAQKWLVEAEKGISAKAFDSALMASYVAMFHSARAILFFDGFREKSHYCVARYIEDNYAKKGFLESKWVSMLDHYRDMRHDDQYSLSFLTTQEEAETSLETAKKFVEQMGALLQKLKQR
ncbi:MAG: HEPN domain-containing protein, partial [Nanoarchaeota archaeon]|nr:HEPN domain-containing protein [Nanoarchaeota archaeon]